MLEHLFARGAPALPREGIRHKAQGAQRAQAQGVQALAIEGMASWGGNILCWFLNILICICQVFLNMIYFSYVCLSWCFNFG